MVSLLLFQEGFLSLPWLQGAGSARLVRDRKWTRHSPVLPWGGSPPQRQLPRESERRAPFGKVQRSLGWILVRRAQTGERARFSLRPRPQDWVFLSLGTTVTHKNGGSGGGDTVGAGMEQESTGQGL